MEHNQAEFWAECINALFAGRKYIWTAVHEYKGWEPEVRAETFDKATAMHSPEIKHHWVMMHDSYGVADFSLSGEHERIQIDADRRTILIRHKSGAGAWIWWAMTDTDNSDESRWYLWRDYQKRSWQIRYSEPQPAKAATEGGDA